MPYLYFHENPFVELKHIHQHIFLAKFHENPTLSGGADSILDSANSLPLQLNQLPLVRSHYMKLCKENLMLNIFTLTQRMLDIYFPTLSGGGDSNLDSANSLAPSTMESTFPGKVTLYETLQGESNTEYLHTHKTDVRYLLSNLIRGS